MKSQAARLPVLALLVTVHALAGCASRPTAADSAAVPVRSSARTPPRRPAAAVSVAERAAAVAVQQLGVPYRYGGSTRRGFDCSGLVHYAYSQAGAMTPRTTGDLWRKLQPVSGGQLEVGDVLFFDIAGKVSHVGLYLGDGRFVHAPSSGREVTIATLSSGYYRKAFVRGGRLP